MYLLFYAKFEKEDSKADRDMEKNSGHMNERNEYAGELLHMFRQGTNNEVKLLMLDVPVNKIKNE